MKPTHPSPTHVPCTVCGAFSGSWCRRNGKPLFPVHRTRLNAFFKWIKENSDEDTQQRSLPGVRSQRQAHT